MYQGDEDIYRALEAGAATYLLKDTLSDDLIRVVREVHAGCNHAAAERRDAPGGARHASRGLTTREVEVLELIAEGLRNKEIAAALRISEETVQVHVKNILREAQRARPHRGGHGCVQARDHSRRSHSPSVLPERSIRS